MKFYKVKLVSDFQQMMVNMTLEAVDVRRAKDRAIAMFAIIDQWRIVEVKEIIGNSK